jgi:HK97 family phage prohead protease
VDQTDDIDRGKARAHLEAHAAAWGGGQSSQLAPEHVRGLRAEQFGGQRRFRPSDGARLATFGGQFRHELVVVNGKELVQLDGYASVVEQEYEMWDMFGPYGETVAGEAFDRTLGSAPDVAFLTNHKGVTMARSGGANPTLTLDSDPRGLHAQALVNPKRNDVHDLLLAIDDENVTEMSFAFRIEDWEWDEDYMHVRILEVDIDRGDVSAVNFGANPYTSIAARTQEFMALLPHLTEGAGRAALDRLAARYGVPAATITRATTEAAAGRRTGQDQVPALRGGRSVNLVERLQDLNG